MLYLHDMKANTLILTLSILLFVSSFGFTQSDPIHESISVQQADSLVQSFNDSSNFVILDVRTETEYVNGHIEGAINVDYYSEDFDQNLSLLNREKKYLVYCGSGGRSTSSFNKMKALEFETLYNMLGGINAWISAGFPVVKGGGTGIDEFFIQHSNLNFYPNPITPESKFIFASSESSICHIVILNLQGQSISEFSLHAGESWSLEGQQLSPGLYFYLANINGSLLKTGRIVKQ